MTKDMFPKSPANIFIDFIGIYDLLGLLQKPHAKKKTIGDLNKPVSTLAVDGFKDLPNYAQLSRENIFGHMAVCQNLVPLVNIKIAGKWMFIPLKMVCIGIDP